jgi:YD repeat-containing protein
MYDDDGKSQEYLSGAGMWTAFTWHDADKRLEVRMDSRTAGRPASRDFEVVLLPDNQRRKVTFTGTPVELKF